jgi:uncharacterized membrane protein YkvA (DUF1232 family)
MLATLRRWAKLLKSDIVALWFAYRDPRTPWHAKAFAVLVVAYAFSPIDLIPDFIPVLGFVDDAILLPLGIWLALKLVPAPVMEAARAQAAAWLAARQPKPRNWVAAAVFVALWCALAWLLWLWLSDLLR